jgi:hypothetical protein
MYNTIDNLMAEKCIEITTLMISMTFKGENLPDYIPAWMRSDAYGARSADCTVCGKNYVVEIDYSDGYHGRGSSTHVVPCPNCHYDPKLEGEVNKEIEGRVSVTFDNRGKAKFNIEEMAMGVNKIIRRHWKEEFERRNK